MQSDVDPGAASLGRLVGCLHHTHRTIGIGDKGEAEIMDDSRPNVLSPEEVEAYRRYGSVVPRFGLEGRELERLQALMAGLAATTSAGLPCRTARWRMAACG